MNLKTENFLSTLSETNIVLDQYASWTKIEKNMDEFEFSCKQLNNILAKNEKEFIKKFDTYFEYIKQSFYILPRLISRNSNQFSYYEDDKILSFNINDKDTVLDFIKKSGLMKNVFANKKCLDVYTYCLGVEVGLDSNSRKNKSGKWASNIFEQILKNNGVNDYKKEVKLSDFFEFKTIKQSNFKNKRIDYYFEYKECKYLVELNYFNTSGSKIDSESDRFIALNEFINNNNKDNKYIFMYITDGSGWEKHSKKLEMILSSIEHCYNFKMFQDFMDSTKKK